MEFQFFYYQMNRSSIRFRLFFMNVGKFNISLFIFIYRERIQIYANFSTENLTNVLYESGLLGFPLHYF